MDAINETKVLMECGVCNESFDADKHRPVILQCSHSFCMECVVTIVQSSRNTCPVCRQYFQANSSDDLIINRNLLDLINYINQKKTKPSVKKQETSCNEWQKNTCLEVKAYIDRFQKARTKTEEAIKANEELTEEIVKINKAITEDIMVKLKKVVEENAKITQELRMRNDKLKRNTKTTIKTQEKMEKVRSRMKDAKNFTAAGVVLDETNDMRKTAQAVLKEMILGIKTNRTAVLKNKKAVSKMQRKTTSVGEILDTTMDEEEAGKTDEAEGDDVDIEDDPDLFLGGGATALHEEACTYLTIDDLRKTRGDVYAAHSFGGGRRYARVTRTDGDDKKLYVHHLKEEKDLPSRAKLIKYEDLKALMKSSDLRTFIDLSVGKKPLGRIVIKYYDNKKCEAHVKNHLHLCTGETGSVFVGSNALELRDKGTPYESLVLGDYERNDGTGGKAVVLKLKDKKKWSYTYKNDGNVDGFVCQYGSTKATASQFCIFTEFPSSCKAFGRVIENLHVLKGAVQREDVKEIKIKDCGLIVVC